MQAIRLGASDFLEKPFRPEDLRISVASVLDEPISDAEVRNENYDDVLSAVRHALRAGKLDVAESKLMRAGTISDRDAGFLNLAGVIHEAHGRRASAERFYEKALQGDAAYQPARQNLDRLTVIQSGGITDAAVALGDCAPCLHLRKAPEQTTVFSIGKKPMYDLIFIFATIGFFGVSILYTHACGRM